jgi:hypothetical protein
MISWCSVFAAGGSHSYYCADEGVLFLLIKAKVDLHVCPVSVDGSISFLFYLRTEVRRISLYDDDVFFFHV